MNEKERCPDCNGTGTVSALGEDEYGCLAGTVIPCRSCAKPEPA